MHKSLCQLFGAEVENLGINLVKENDFVSEFVQVVFEKESGVSDISIGTSDAVKPSPNISMDDMPSPGRPQVSFLTNDNLIRPSLVMDHNNKAFLWIECFIILPLESTAFVIK